MSSRLLAVFAVVGLALVPSASAQELLVNRLQPQFHGAAVDTEAWYVHGIELVEAQLFFDVRAAMVTAERLWSVAENTELAGARPAVAALAELVHTRLEGPATAGVWRQRADRDPLPASAWFRACFHLARARCLCLHEQHADELAQSIPGQAAADESGAALPRLRAGQMNLHLTPGRGLAAFERLFTELAKGPEAAAAATYEPWLLVDQHVDAFTLGQLQAANAILDQVEAAARRDGNRRVLALASQYRGDCHQRVHEIEPAIAAYAAATPLLEALGDRYQLVCNLDLRAYLHLRLGDVERAEPLVEAAEALLFGRGMRGCEREILHTRLEMAIRQRDGDRAADIKDELEAEEAASAASQKRLIAARAELSQVEADRFAAEEQLRLTAEKALDRARNQRTLAGAGIILALTVLAAVTWRSRRKLVLANAALAEQMQRAEVAQAAKAQLEERMRQLERTESLGTMAAGVAHDFNNLLTSILGNAELIAESSVEGEQEELARGIALAGQQAARLCRQLQVYSGGAPTVSMPVDLVSLVCGLLPMLRAATQGAVDIEFIPGAATVGALGDPAQLEQVLLNLVVNARDAKAHAVRIRVGNEERAVQPAASDLPRGAAAWIEVADDGEGMTADIANRIFDPFFTTRFPGRGLGLAVVYGVARRLGGSVSVTSAPGCGATFRLQLPGALAPVPALEPVVELPRPPAPAQRTALLVVDDDGDVRRMLDRMLRQLGHSPDLFADGPSVLAALANVPPGLLVLLIVDMAMPGMDGAEVVRAVRQRLPSVRVVLMSGHAQSYVEQIAREVQPDHVLAKPFTLDALRNAIAAAAAERVPGHAGV